MTPSWRMTIDSIDQQARPYLCPSTLPTSVSSCVRNPRKLRIIRMDSLVFVYPWSLPKEQFSDGSAHFKTGFPVSGKGGDYLHVTARRTCVHLWRSREISRKHTKRVASLTSIVSVVATGDLRAKHKIASHVTLTSARVDLAMLPSLQTCTGF